jgi:type II secretory pathway pseudopilin PulG
MENIIEMGVWAIIGIAILSVLATLALHFLAQRSQQHSNETAQSNLYNLHSLGIQAIIGANEMKIVDESLESRKEQPQPQVSQTLQGGSKT